MSMQQDRHSRVRSWAEWRHGDAVTMAMAFMVELAAGGGGWRLAAFANCGFVGVGGGLWGDFGGMPVFTHRDSLKEMARSVGGWIQQDTTNNKQQKQTTIASTKSQIKEATDGGGRLAAGGERYKQGSAKTKR